MSTDSNHDSSPRSCSTLARLCAMAMSALAQTPGCGGKERERGSCFRLSSRRSTTINW